MCKIPVWSIKPLTCLFCETQHAIHCKHIIQAAQYLYVLNIWIINKPVVIRCLCCNPNSNICIISRTAFSVVHFCFTRTTQYLFWDFFFPKVYRNPHQDFSFSFRPISLKVEWQKSSKYIQPCMTPRQLLILTLELHHHFLLKFWWFYELLQSFSLLLFSFQLHSSIRFPTFFSLHPLNTRHFETRQLLSDANKFLI